MLCLGVALKNLWEYLGPQIFVPHSRFSRAHLDVAKKIAVCGSPQRDMNGLKILQSFRAELEDMMTSETQAWKVKTVRQLEAWRPKQYLGQASQPFNMAVLHFECSIPDSFY